VSPACGGLASDSAQPNTGLHLSTYQERRMLSRDVCSRVAGRGLRIRSTWSGVTYVPVQTGKAWHQNEKSGVLSGGEIATMDEGWWGLPTPGRKRHNAGRR